MVLVSESPGESYGAIGVVTLEDVIEELIGEEIVDETDVFVDVSRRLKRMNPAAAFAHHSFHRISSRKLLRHSSDISSDSFKNSGTHAANLPTVGNMKPLNKASEPKPTTSTKVTIKPGTEVRNAQHAATVVSQERLAGKKAARENYGTIGTNSSGGATTGGSGSGVDKGDVPRTRSSPTLMEEHITVSGDGENGKVVIIPVKSHDDDEGNDRTPLL